MRIASLCAVVALLLSALPRFVLADDDLAGEWKSDKISIDISTETDQATGVSDLFGTIKQGSNSFPFTGKANADGIKGQFKAGDKSYDFTATVKGDTMTFKTGTTTYELKNATPKKSDNPLDNPDGPAPEPKKKNPLDDDGPVNPDPVKPDPVKPDPVKPEPAVDDKNVIKHPAGFSVVVPPNYNGQVNEQFVELMGPRSEQTGRPSSYIRVGAVQDPTFTNVEDPAYLRGAATSMQAEEPGLKPAGEWRAQTSGGAKVMVLPLTIEGPGVNEPVPARAMIVDMGNKQVGVVFIAAQPDQIQSAEALGVQAAARLAAGTAK